jgi:ABC-type uncharacterized transport system permease subunit
MKLKIDVIDRDLTNPGSKFLVFMLSVLAGFMAVGILFAFEGVNPFEAFFRIMRSAFGSALGIQSTIAKMIPLLLIASGLAVVFRGKFWNIGAEGQLILGASFTTWVGLNLGPHLPPILLIPIMLLAGIIGGALWAIPPVILKIRFGINEVISTLMLNYVAIELVNFLITGPWKGETQLGRPLTDNIPEAARLGLLPRTEIHVFTLIIALIVSVVLFFVLFRTRFGYEVRVLGENQEAAKYAGINIVKTSILMMVISGGVAGIAGFGEIAGIHHHLTYANTISAGYGFTAIIVAWLGRLNPLLAIASGVFFAGIIVGGVELQISFGLPAATVEVFNGVILIFLIMGDYFLRHKIEIRNLSKEIREREEA